MRNVYAWMANNPESVIELSVHGNQQYDKIVMERLIKNEERRQKKEEEERVKRQAKEAENLIPELSDEEANEDIRRGLA